jgi:hypothetical protein
MNWKNSTSGTLPGSVILFFTEGARIRARALADGKRGVPNSLDSTFATVRQLHDPTEGFESGELSPNFFGRPDGSGRLV